MYDYYWDDFDCEIQCEELYMEYDFSDIPYDPLDDEGLPF